MAFGDVEQDHLQKLTSKEKRDFFLLRVRIDVDGLTYIYDSLKKANDSWNQLIMVSTSIGDLITSIMTIAGWKGWPFEIVPIIIQTLAGMMAGWMRFYDFPKRMEAVINAKHSSNDVRYRLQKARKEENAISDTLWDNICNSAKEVDSVLTPSEREKAHKAAIKYQRNEIKRAAQIKLMLACSIEDLATMSTVNETESEDSVPPSPGFRLSSLIPSVGQPSRRKSVEQPTHVSMDDENLNGEKEEKERSLVKVDTTDQSDHVSIHIRDINDEKENITLGSVDNKSDSISDESETVETNETSSSIVDYNDVAI